MKKSLRFGLVAFLTMLLIGFSALFITSCDNNLIGQNIKNPQDTDASGIKADSFFWGTWVRMDNGTEYEVLETSVVQGSKSYTVTASDSSTLSVNSLGTFKKESDSVIICNNIPYFRNGGTNLEYSLKLVGFTQFSSSLSVRAADTVIGGKKAKGKSAKYPDFESNGESDSEGNIKLKAPTANDSQTVTITNGDDIVVIPGLKINNSGDYMGTVALVGKDDYNLKITGTISNEQKDNGYLFGNNAKSYDMDITISNISNNKCTTSICTIESDDPNLSIISKDGTVLSAFTISTLAANATKNVKVSLNYGNLTQPFVDTGVTITIRNPATGQEWKDYVPLRFFKGMIPIAVSGQSTEKNDQAALNGFIIYPDGNNQFFCVKNNSSKILYVPSFGKEKKYMMVFSGATVTSTLSDSTEMYYTVAPGTTKIREVDTKSGDVDKMIEYMMFGGNNHSEDNAYNTTESFQAYLSEGEIDYYTLNADSEEFYAPGAKSFAVISYSSEYEDVPASFYITEGSKLTEEKLPKLEHEGLEFLGWYDGKTKVTAGKYTVNGDVLLTAKWDYKKYDITYNLDGGTNAKENPAYYTIENEILTLAAPTKKGYDFEGWFTNKDFSGEKITSISTFSMNAITLYAKWKPVSYKITYVLNGGEAGAADEVKNSSDNPATYTIEDSVTFDKATRKGYAFSGWYDNEAFSGNKVKGISLGTTEAITLYARWLKECTVTYVTDHGTAPDAVIVGETDKISEENLPELECSGYIFEGWYDNTTPVIADSYTVTGNVTLTAQWNLVRYTISYYLNGGNNSTLNPSCYTIETEKYTLETPVKTGYDFEGWFTDSSFNGNAVVEIAGGATENLILYAKWKPTVYTITYELDGGSNASSNPRTYTIETNTITLDDPQKNGFVFRGWFENETFTGTKQTEIAKGSYNNKTYYAKWLKKCTVSFVTQHGTAPETIVLGEGESFTISQIPKVTEKGWSLKGWYTDSSFDDEKKITSNFVVTNDIELYAKWEVEILTTTVTILPAGTDGTAGTGATYVLFGDWPQTIKAGNITVDESVSEIHGGFTYYRGSDGAWYVKCTENAYESSYTYSDGTTVKQSNANSTKYFKVEPIKWRVLTTDYNNTGKALLLAENILTANVPYYGNTLGRTINFSSVSTNNYKYSTIRAFLNGEYESGDSPYSHGSNYRNIGFLQSAFTIDAQTLIETTTVDNSAASTRDTGNNFGGGYSCVDTSDKLFLLSEKEVTTSSYGFAAYDSYGVGNARIRLTTDYAKANYAFQYNTSGYGGLWWLRSPGGTYNNCACFINDNGTASSYSNVCVTRFGVVPALTISLE